MTEKGGPIQSEYQRLATIREPVLERARLLASLTDPAILPRKLQTQDHEQTENWQSIGSRGLDQMASAYMFATWPVNQPWGALSLPPRIEYAPDADRELLRQVKERLMMVEMVARAKLEQSYVKPKSNRRHLGFRSVKRQVVKSILATGEALEYLDNDYRLHMYRRDRYVTVRNDAGDVLMHIVAERVDPLDVSIGKLGTDQVLVRAKLNRGELEDKDIDKRMMDLYTRVKWQGGKWLITQELNGEQINEFTESVSPFFSTCYDLLPGEHYGRGYIENKLGDLLMLDKSSQRLAEIAARAARSIVVNDESKSRIRSQQMEKWPNGSVQSGAVENVGDRNFVPGLALIESINIPETSVLAQYVQTLRLELGKAFGLELDLQPRGDRVTATQVLRVASAADRGSDGMLPSTIEQQHTPLMQRLIYMVNRDHPGLVPTLPDDAEIKVTTGLAAMTREQDLEKLLQGVQYLTAIGGQDALDIAAISQQILNMLGFTTDQVLKSQEQRQQEQDAQVAAQAQQAAAQEAVSVVGDATRAQFERNA